MVSTRAFRRGEEAKVRYLESVGKYRALGGGGGKSKIFGIWQ